MMITVFRTLLDKLFQWLTATETTLAEFWGSTMLMGMGFWLMLPFDTFESIPAYSVMERLMPESAWGACAIVLGGFQSYANVSHRESLRIFAAFFSSVMFAFVGSLALLSEPASLLAPICGTASFIEGVVYLRLSFLKREAPRDLR